MADCGYPADIVERFQLALMLSVIAVRNMVEMSGSDFAFLPKSFIRGTNLIETIWSVSGAWGWHSTLMLTSRASARLGGHSLRDAGRLAQARLHY